MNERTTTDFETLLESLSSMVAHLQSLAEMIPPELRAATDFNVFEDMFFCMQLAIDFYKDANRALQAEAWFSSSVAAASALESVLLAKCLMHKDAVVTLPKWNELQKVHRGDFGKFVRSMDLGKLLEIANQLEWLKTKGVPSGFTQAMAPHWTDDARDEFLLLFAGEENVGQLCANRFREYRNMLHPAVCLRENSKPTKEMYVTATYLFLIAFSALAQTDERAT